MHVLPTVIWASIQANTQKRASIATYTDTCHVLVWATITNTGLSAECNVYCRLISRMSAVAYRRWWLCYFVPTINNGLPSVKVSSLQLGIREDFIDRHNQHVRVFFTERGQTKHKLQSAILKEKLMSMSKKPHQCLINTSSLIQKRGEPGLPVSTGVRGHNLSIVPLHGQRPAALDHIFHVHSMVLVSFFLVNTCIPVICTLVFI